MDDKTWRVTDCFSGPSCWCGIIVDPNGEEQNGYGYICREACQAIVDSLNGELADHSDLFKRFPLPWHVRMIDEYGLIVTTPGLTTERMEDCIFPAGDLNQKTAELFVNSVNAQYYK